MRTRRSDLQRDEAEGARRKRDRADGARRGSHSQSIRWKSPDARGTM
jgi:hypothetical protein